MAFVYRTDTSTLATEDLSLSAAREANYRRVFNGNLRFFARDVKLNLR